MDRAGVQAWLDRYVDAWQQNEAAPIEALFTEDATYRFAPFGDENMARGRAEIVKGWLDNPDPTGTWEAHYQPFVVDGNGAVATGTSHYLPAHPSGERVYHNVYLLEFAPDGRCSAFTELYMREQERAPQQA
jgi:SnoaL-like domain